MKALKQNENEKNIFLTIFVVLSLIAAVVAILLIWPTETVMARAKNSDRKFYYEIVVREIKGSPIQDGALYQCEFYRPKIKHPWSTQTYSGDSFIANSARVVWINEREATVFLDESPVFKCIDGWWTKP